MAKRGKYDDVIPMPGEVRSGPQRGFQRPVMAPNHGDEGGRPRQGGGGQGGQGRGGSPMETLGVALPPVPQPMSPRMNPAGDRVITPGAPSPQASAPAAAPGGAAPPGMHYDADGNLEFDAVGSSIANARVQAGIPQWDAARGQYTTGGVAGQVMPPVRTNATEPRIVPDGKGGWMPAEQGYGDDGRVDPHGGQAAPPTRRREREAPDDPMATLWPDRANPSGDRAGARAVLWPDGANPGDMRGGAGGVAPLAPYDPNNPPVFQSVPRDEEIANIPEGGVFHTPWGTGRKVNGALGSIELNDAGKRAYAEAKMKAHGEVIRTAPYPLADDPRAPQPPIEPGKPFFHPFAPEGKGWL